MPSDALRDPMALDPTNRNLCMNTKFRRHDLFQEFNTVDWTSSSVSQIDTGRGNDQVVWYMIGQMRTLATAATVYLFIWLRSVACLFLDMELSLRTTLALAKSDRLGPFIHEFSTSFIYDKLGTRSCSNVTTRDKETTGFTIWNHLRYTRKTGLEPCAAPLGTWAKKSLRVQFNIIYPHAKIKFTVQKIEASSE